METTTLLPTAAPSGRGSTTMTSCPPDRTPTTWGGCANVTRPRRVTASSPTSHVDGGRALGAVDRRVIVVGAHKAQPASGTGLAGRSSSVTALLSATTCASTNGRPGRGTSRTVSPSQVGGMSKRTRLHVRGCVQGFQGVRQLALDVRLQSSSQRTAGRLNRGVKRAQVGASMSATSAVVPGGTCRATLPSTRLVPSA